jgi:hypothetical protein
MVCNNNNKQRMTKAGFGEIRAGENMTGGHEFGKRYDG